MKNIPYEFEQIGQTFVMQAIQEWGQSEEDRIKAVQAVLDKAGFNATATCRPVFSSIWPKPCAGPDAEAATAFLKDITETMKRGKFENETAHVAHKVMEKVKRGSVTLDGTALGL